jgi:hypothetical protein
VKFVYNNCPFPYFKFLKAKNLEIDIKAGKAENTLDVDLYADKPSSRSKKKMERDFVNSKSAGKGAFAAGIS